MKWPSPLNTRFFIKNVNSWKLHFLLPDTPKNSETNFQWNFIIEPPLLPLFFSFEKKKPESKRAKEEKFNNQHSIFLSGIFWHFNLFNRFFLLSNFYHDLKKFLKKFAVLIYFTSFFYHFELKKIYQKKKRKEKDGETACLMLKNWKKRLKS